MSWISLADHFKVDELAWTRLRLIELDNSNQYHWLAAKVVGTPSILNIAKAITNADIMVDNYSIWSVLLVGPLERMCSSFWGLPHHNSTWELGLIWRCSNSSPIINIGNLLWSSFSIPIHGPHLSGWCPGSGIDLASPPCALIRLFYHQMG